MSAQLIEIALAEWREGERLLRDLPRTDPDHETVRVAVIRLRETYKRLNEHGADTSDQLADCRQSIAAARDTIEHVRARHVERLPNNALEGNEQAGAV